jgi:hypothetical protein
LLDKLKNIREHSHFDIKDNKYYVDAWVQDEVDGTIWIARVEAKGPKDDKATAEAVDMLLESLPKGE